MAPTPPLPVTEDTPPDMLAGSMDLRVVLPSGRAVNMSVQRGTPMMDLLVQVATANKIPPGGHVIQAVGERGLLPYKPNTPIGALDTWTIQMVPKSRVIPTASVKKAPLKPSNQQPFEQTFRLQVHLPRNQLFVARVSPKTLLSDVLALACTEKNLDTSKYELRHPANLEERLRSDWTLADYKLQEVTMVSKGGRPLGAGLSSSDIMALQKEEEKRRQQTRAAGGTGSAVLGLMFNKRSRSSMCDGSISSDSLGGRSISPVRSDGTPSPPGSSLPPPRPARKRRPAPKPPVQPAAVISHSRNSSDSSGYHEASVLSESPESNGLSSPSGTLPRRSKLTSTAPAPPPSSSLSRSLSNLTSMSSTGSKTLPRGDGMKNCVHSVSTSSLASSGHAKKKKAAPPPPPPVVANKRTVSMSTLSSQASTDSYESSSKPPMQEIVLEEIPMEQPTESKFVSVEAPQDSSLETYSESSSTTSSPERQINIPEKHVAQVTPNEPMLVEVPQVQSSVETKSRSSPPVELRANSEEPALVVGKSLVAQPSPELNVDKQRLSRSEEPAPVVGKTLVAQPSPELRADKKRPSRSDDPAPVVGMSLVAQPSPNALPDVVSGSSTPPTPKPRLITSSSTEQICPVPQPRRSVQPVTGSSASSSELGNYGTLSRTFGIGATMVKLAELSGSNSELEMSSNTLMVSDSGIASFQSGIDDDQEALKIDDGDLEMFEMRKDGERHSLVDATPQLAMYDNISIISSAFDSEHETSDGTWGRCSLRSRDLRRGQFVMRQDSTKIRAGSLRSLDEMEGGGRLGRWSCEQDLHAESDLQAETEELERAFQSVTDELEAAILADELKEASPLLAPPSPVDGSQSPSLSDWEYQLPAPPSAFRDRHSPTPTQGETVDLANTGVFDEKDSIVSEHVKKQISPEPKSRVQLHQHLAKQLNENIKINPLFNARKYDVEQDTERLSEKSNETESSVSAEVDADDWEPQQLRADPDPNVEMRNSRNNLSHRSSFNNDTNQSHQLKNFTITTYQRPRDTDNIFNDENKSGKLVQSEFKKPIQVSVYSSGSQSTLPRTNSFNANNNEHIEHSGVKRSTSHVSLVNSGRNFRTKSIGNIAVAVSREGRKMSESEKAENGHERLRTTTSEVNISLGSEESSRPAEQNMAEQPLQSLQVMRTILNPSGQERVRDMSSSEQVPSRTNNLVQQLIQNAENSDAGQPTQRVTETTNNESGRRYTYRGPPAVNFSTWSERPKSQVSIKVDSDYRIGKGQGGINQDSQPALELRDKENTYETDCNSGHATSNTDDVKPSVNQSVKIEAAPLTMRIVSHTTSLGYKRTPSFSNQRINFISKTEDQPAVPKEPMVSSHQPAIRTSSYNSAQIADPSRVPIVRAVELKKSFIQGSGTSVQLSWNEADKRNGETEEPETFQGVNNLAKRFSIAAPSTECVRVGFRAPSSRPVSAYLYSGSNEASDAAVDMKRNSTSTSALNNIGTNDSFTGSSNLNGARKYTSVVGINGAGISTSNYREPEVNRMHTKITNSASIKVNSFTAAKQPMPVVKGFRFASNGANHSDASLIAVNSHKPEPLTVKVQRSDSYANKNQRSSTTEAAPTFNVRIHHAPVAKVDSSVANMKQMPIPVPPPAPAPLKRPKSFLPPEPNARDQLMDAIRSFGGRTNLRQNGGS